MGLFSKKPKQPTKQIFVPNPFPSDDEFVRWYDHLNKEDRFLFLNGTKRWIQILDPFGPNSQVVETPGFREAITEQQLQILKNHNHLIVNEDTEDWHYLDIQYDITAGDEISLNDTHFPYQMSVNCLKRYCLKLDPDKENIKKCAATVDQALRYLYPRLFKDKGCFGRIMLARVSPKNNKSSYSSDFTNYDHAHPRKGEYTDTKKTILYYSLVLLQLTNFEQFTSLPEEIQRVYLPYATKDLFSLFAYTDMKQIWTPMGTDKAKYGATSRALYPRELYDKKLEAYVAKKVAELGIKQVSIEDLDYEQYNVFASDVPFDLYMTNNGYDYGTDGTYIDDKGQSRIKPKLLGEICSSFYDGKFCGSDAFPIKTYKSLHPGSERCGWENDFYVSDFLDKILYTSCFDILNMGDSVTWHFCDLEREETCPHDDNGNIIKAEFDFYGPAREVSTFAEDYKERQNLWGQDFAKVEKLEEEIMQDYQE